MKPETIHRQLRTILAELYPTRADLARVATDAGVPLARVDLGHSALNDWEAVLGEAEKQQGVAQLLDVAAHEYPHNPALADAMTAFAQMVQAQRGATLPASNLHLLNFARELTGEQRAQIESALGKRVGKLINLPARFDDARPYGPQCVALAEQVGLRPPEWETLPIVVNPPGFTPAALCLLSELHGRMGYFPAVVRLRPVDGSTPLCFELAEIMNLQALRNAARERGKR
ncbi:MAG: CRISPR-associated protein Csx15 [Caldilineaceae bacterium]